MTMRKHILAAVLVFLSATSLKISAQNALSFSRIDRNPRTSAMAGAGMASVAGTGYAAFGNAAALGFQNGMADVAAGVQLWEMSNEADKATHLQAGAGFRFGNFGVAVGGAYQMGQLQGTFTPNDLLLSMGLAYNIADVVSVGVNGRYASQSLTREAKVNGFSADITVMGRFSPQFTVAAGVGNIGPKVKGSTDSYAQPSYARAGVAWTPADAFALMLDGEYNFDGTLAAALGAEYNYHHIVYARAGYRIASEKALIPSHLGAGVGLHLGGFRVEASYLTASPVLGNTVTLGVAYSL